MNKFETVSSPVMTLPLKDVDTDLIIPAQFLTGVTREGYGKNLFRRLRDSDPAFPLNRSEFAAAQILVADHNFGCGSSREHAVWAIVDAGIRVVIAKSFADIFSGNSAKNGLLLVTLPEPVVDRILSDPRAGSGEYRLSVDLRAQQIVFPEGDRVPFDYDPFRKHCLLEGLDDIDYIRAQSAEIEKYRASRNNVRYFSTLTPNNCRNGHGAGDVAPTCGATKS